MKEMPDAYWGGLFDGEGCIQPYHYVSKIHKEKFIVAFRASVSQKEPMVLYMLQKRFGGYVRTSPVVTEKGFKTKRGVWECSRTEDVISFLATIKPYIVVKEVEVMVALEILESVLKTRDQYVINKDKKVGGFSGKVPIELDEIKRRQILEQKFYQDRRDWKEVEIKVEPKINSTLEEK
jgi:hypothetical protein